MKTRAQLRAQWKADREALCEKWGLTVEQADDLLDALPYSSIPGWHDLDQVLQALAETRQE